jgi:hypothetical protein
MARLPRPPMRPAARAGVVISRDLGRQAGQAAKQCQQHGDVRRVRRCLVAGERDWRPGRRRWKFLRLRWLRPRRRQRHRHQQGSLKWFRRRVIVRKRERRSRRD